MQNSWPAALPPSLGFIGKISVAYLVPISWLVHSQHLGQKLSIAHLAPILWLVALSCIHFSHSHVENILVTTAVALTRQRHAVEFICNLISSHLRSQAFIFMQLSSLARPWIANFTCNCDCHAMVNSLTIAQIAIFTRNMWLSWLRLYAVLKITISVSKHRLPMTSDKATLVSEKQSKIES